MSAITKFTITGRALLAAAVANGQALASAKIAVGDANGAVYVPDEAQTALVHEVWRGVANVARDEDRVVFTASIPANVGPFTVREVGVFLGAPGAEQLFVISQHPVTEKLASPANGSGPLPLTLGFSASEAQIAVLPAGASGTAVLHLQNAPHITVDGIITAPPGAPVDGMLYAIDAGATGTFTGQAGKLVERVSDAWVFRPMRNYSIIRDTSSGAWYENSGADWVPYAFNDASIDWTDVQNKPTEFPPAAHTHPYLPLAGGTLTGALAGTSAAFSGAVSGGAVSSSGQIKARLASNGYNTIETGTSTTSSGYLTTYSPSGRLAYFGFWDGAVVHAAMTDGATALTFGTGGTERMRITGGGNILLGGASDAGAKLEVSGNVGVSGALRLGSGFGTDSQILISKAGAANQWSSVGALMPRLQYQLRYANGTGRQTIATGLPAWAKITLNTVMVNDAGWTAASGVVTLPAGTYRVRMSATLELEAFVLRLRDTSNSVTLINSGQSNATTNTDLCTTLNAEGQFVLAGSAAVELQFYPLTSRSTVSSVGASGLGEPQTVATLTIERVA